MAVIIINLSVLKELKLGLLVYGGSVLKKEKSIKKSESFSSNNQKNGKIQVK